MRKIDRCIAKGIVAPLAAVYAAAIGTIGAILFQAGAADSFQIVVPVGVRPDRHLVRDPGKRDIGRLLSYGRRDRSRAAGLRRPIPAARAGL